METLASIWAHDPSDPCDLRDLGEKRHELSSVWESEYVFSSSPPATPMWTQQLSPHLQRNKQLQDTLLQREEELSRLQEENNKLREFLSSSFVRTLEEKAKKLTTDGRRKLKRNLMDVNERSFPNCGHQLVASQPVSKRVCRNLTAEFSSESSDTSASSEQNLDLWVLQTLGLKDRDTIDTSNNSLSSSGYSIRGLVYDTAVTSVSSSGHTLNSLSPSVSTSPSSSAHSYCQSSTCQPEYRYNADKCQEANDGGPVESAQNCIASLSPRPEFTATALNGHYEPPEAVIRRNNRLPFTQPPDTTEICSITASSQIQTSSQEHPVYWSPLTDSQTPTQDTVQFSSPGGVHFSPMLTSTPVSNPPWSPVGGCSPSSQSAGSQTPVTPHSRTDLAFSMSLNMTSSVKTHSFPQGQAFIRKDTEGRWNFTWVPRQGP